MPTLIILRGNSGSGKSTVASMLQQHFGPNTLLIDQDKVRIEMLRTKDRENNLAIPLLKEITLFGAKNCEVTILEGILSPSRYKGILNDLIAVFSPNVHIYYFDIPFEETVRRHATRDKAKLFTEDDMKRWWKEKDFLGYPYEQIIDHHSSAIDTVNRILKDVQIKKDLSEKSF